MLPKHTIKNLTKKLLSELNSFQHVGTERMRIRQTTKIMLVCWNQDPRTLFRTWNIHWPCVALISGKFVLHCLLRFRLSEDLSSPLSWLYEYNSSLVPSGSTDFAPIVSRIWNIRVRGTVPQDTSDSFATDTAGNCVGHQKVQQQGGLALWR